MHAGEQHALFNVTVDHAALGYQRIVYHRIRADVMGRQSGALGIDAPFLFGKAELRLFAKKIHVRLPKGADGTDVLPIAAEAVSVKVRARVKQIGDYVLAEIVRAGFILLVGDKIGAEGLPVENVDAHGGLVALGRLGLLLKIDYPVSPVRVHYAEA